MSWQRKFYTIWSGQAVSLITSAILQMAIILHLTETTGSAMVLSVASLVAFLPYAVFGPFIGVFVDRHDRKLIMIGADLGIALAGAVLAVVALVIELPIWLVMFVLFVRSVGTAFHTPALNAVTPLLVPEDQLTRCAGLSQSLQSVSFIVSPALGALLYSTWELNAIIALDVVGALIASATVAVISIPRLEHQTTTKAPSVLGEIADGFRVLRHYRGLFGIVLIGTLFMLIFMPINALYPLMSINHFNGTALHVSVAEIVYASGMLIGGLVLGLIGTIKKRVPMMAGAVIMMGIGLSVSGLLPETGFIWFVACCFIMGLSVPFYTAVQTALIQERIEPEYLGRIFSLMGSIMSLAMPIGLLISGLFADQVGVAQWFLVSGILIMATGFIFPAVKDIRELDAIQPELNSR